MHCSLFIGCPFKHSEIDMLAQKLRSQHISKDNVEKVCIVIVGDSYYRIQKKKSFEENCWQILPRLTLRPVEHLEMF